MPINSLENKICLEPKMGKLGNKAKSTAGAELFAYLSSERQDALRQLGRENCQLGAKLWDKATPEQRD